ncbi:NAD(P)-dependent oxidoreductase [Saccharothrix syringae]|uniref:Epimerase n=1 Tax=Saccharothrix syringae TaxID=103733 RepID=A0A5Q0H5N2_SACSY|nr:NAD(P)H-binding protein [Saccharothrix syringae]QFZ21449.1 epimerase [Saccharothrix syringae]
MRLVVLGATGGTGRALVRRALALGHHVTAAVRDPGRLPVRHDDLDVRTPDFADPEGMAELLRGEDAVLSALGPRGRRDAGVVAPLTGVLASAAGLAGTRRLLVVSASPVGDAPADESPAHRLLVTPLVRRVFRTVYADLAAAERLLAGSPGLDWTVVRPPRLLDGPGTGEYRVRIGGSLPRATSIDRADVARAMLSFITDERTFRQVVGIAR